MPFPDFSTTERSEFDFMSQSKKQSFLHGTALLAAATAIVKIIGALYKIPLKMIIGDEGFSYFNTAYEIYSLLLLISTAGLPVAMSRMISQASALGHSNQVRKVYTTSRNLFLILGIAGTLLMTLCSKWLASFQGQPDAWYAIACLGPCVLLICMMSTYRGFFQGQGNMIPTSVSQVLEAIVKLIVGIGLAMGVMQLTDSIPKAAGGAILGVTVSCVASVLYLLSCFRKGYRQLPESSDEALSQKSTAKQLLAIAIPITIGAAGLQLLTVLETGIYMDNILGLLQDGRYDNSVINALRQQVLTNYPGISLENLQNKVAANLKGIYNMAQTVYNLPVAFVAPITISIIPAITSHLTLQNNRGARATAESAARITGLICMPCAVGLIVLSAPVMALLGGYGGEQLKLASQLMSIMGVCIIFNSVVLLTNAIMQAHGHANLPVVNMFIGGILKLIAVFVLTANPHIAILGTPIGSFLCYVSITALNLLTMRKCISHPPAIMKNLGRSALAAIIMGVVVYGVYYVLPTQSRVLLCAVPVMAGVAVYAFAAIKFKAITHEDCLLLPKGEKLAKLLKL
jgi:stage V sporulation protein B